MKITVCFTGVGQTVSFLKRMMPQVRFAIIDDNMLTCLGLQQLLAEMLPMAEIVVCGSIEELEQQANSHFLHYFVASRLYFEHAQFFRNNKVRCIVLVNGDMQINGVYTLNVCQDEQSLVRSILALHSKGKGPALHSQSSAVQHPVSSFRHETAELLSPREIEVAVHLCKGLINKEIADSLNVSLTTIITHRKNIMEKLHARSVADIIIYCVVNGLVDVGDV